LNLVNTCRIFPQNDRLLQAIVSDLENVSKKDIILLSHYSNIPVFHHPTGFVYGIRLGGLPLTWPEDQFFYF